MTVLNTGGNITEVFGGKQAGGRKVTAKALRRMLKKAGLKTTGRKAALTRRAKKAHLKMRGGEDAAQTPQEEGRACFTESNEAGTIQNGICVAPDMGGRRRRRGSRKSRSRKH